MPAEEKLNRAKQSITPGSIFILLSASLFLFMLLPNAFSWNDPTGSPPDNNVPPALNRGAKAQRKAGSLDIGLDFSIMGYSKFALSTNSIGVGIGQSFFGVVDPSAPLDVDGTVIAELFCFSDSLGNQTSCLSLGIGGGSSLVGPKGLTGDAGPAGPAGAVSTTIGIQGLAGPAGPTGPQGLTGSASIVPGSEGPAGTNAMINYIQTINRGERIIFKNNRGTPVSFFGTNGDHSGIVSRDFTVDLCTGQNEYVKSIDPSGGRVCVSSSPLVGSETGITSVGQSDSPGSIRFFPESNNAIWMAIDQSVIQKRVTGNCEVGMAITQIDINGNVSCGYMNYCEIKGRTFICHDSRGRTKSVLIP